MSVAKKRSAGIGESRVASRAGARDQVTSIAVEARSPLRATGLQIARARALLDDGSVLLDVRGHEVVAGCDHVVHASVIETAVRRGEPLLVDFDADAPLVVGALRTQATIGVDEIAEIDLKAETIRMHAKHVELEGEEVVLSSKAARFVLRAAGEIESFADRIVSRASGVHKIVGRMLRLN